MRRLYLAAIVLLCISACSNPAPPKTQVDSVPMPAGALLRQVRGVTGGRLVTATLSDPETFNPLLFSGSFSQTLNQLMNPGLTRLNLQTQEVEPALAESWDTSTDHLTWTFHLRKGLQWSDGSPFTANDVDFTMRIVHDPKLPSGAQDALTIDDQPVQWTVQSDSVIVAKLPAVYSPFLRQLDGATTPILSKHKWEKSYTAGQFEQAMQVNMDPHDFVCLGPFRIKEFKQGSHLTLERNPNFWEKDLDGKRLPYLNEITFLIASDLNEVELKTETGQIDAFYSIRPEDVERIKEKGKAKGIKVIKVGPGYDFEGLFLNQNGDRNPKTHKPYVDPVKRAWFADPNFRRAISLGIDRNALVRNALYGMGLAARGPESPSNTLWYNDHLPELSYNPKQAAELLKKSGFVSKGTSSEPKLMDKTGHEVRFSLMTNAGNTIRIAECNLIAGDLRKLGIQLDFSAVESKAFSSRAQDTHDYEAILLSLGNTDIDPSSSMDLWPSDGTLHLWWPQQKEPHTPWEKRIDELMRAQMASFDHEERKRDYDEVQQILADQLPIIFTTYQMIHVCARQNLGNFKPAIARDRVLWNGDELFWSKP